MRGVVTPIADVPAGSRVVMARRLGREPVRHTVLVPAGGVVMQDFVLPENPIRLSDVVVTATRDEEKKSDIAANIGVVGEADIQTARPHHSAEIVNRIPGVLNIGIPRRREQVVLRLPITTARCTAT